MTDTTKTQKPEPRYTLKQIIAYAVAGISIVEDDTPSGRVLIEHYVTEALYDWADDRADKIAYYAVEDYKATLKK